MGGYAQIIPVRPSENLLETAKRSKPGGFRRLLGLSGKQPRWKEYERLSAEIELPGFGKPLVEDVLRYVRQMVPNPWPATKTFLDSYLGGIKHNVYVRGERKADGSPHHFYVQVSFSGCSGMADVSSEVAGHWAEIWHIRNRARIEAEYLVPNGLEPSESSWDRTESWHPFLPVGQWGYAALSEEESLQEAIKQAYAGEEFFHFSVDSAVREGDEKQANSFLRHLESRCLDLMKDRRCRCQLCMPEFDPSELELPAPSGVSSATRINKS